MMQGKRTYQEKPFVNSQLSDPYFAELTAFYQISNSAELLLVVQQPLKGTDKSQLEIGL
jgi:hypothetical protein